VDIFKPEKETLQGIAELFQYNTAIKRLVVKDAQAPQSFFSTLALAISANTKCALTTIDLSGNQIEVSIKPYRSMIVCYSVATESPIQSRSIISTNETDERNNSTGKRSASFTSWTGVSKLCKNWIVWKRVTSIH
jgi:hypothetical protein